MREARLKTESASCPALASEAMTDRDANRFALCDQFQLPAATRGFALDHRPKAYVFALSNDAVRFPLP
jgi:hypothetical protein